MSELEERLALYIRVNELPAPEREFRPDKKRRWRFDFAWPARMVALEVEGGIWTGGRHTTGAGFQKDCEKYNEAALRGWKVIRVTGDHVDDGSAIDWLRRALDTEPAEPAPF